MLAIGRSDPTGLVIEKAGEDQPSARSEGGGDRRRELDQRTGEDVGDDEVVGGFRLETFMIEARRDGKHNYYSICRNHFHSLMGELFSNIRDPQTEEVRFEDFVLTQQG